MLKCFVPRNDVRQLCSDPVADDGCKGRERGGEMESTILRCLPVPWKDARKTYEPSMATTLNLGKSIIR